METLLMILFVGALAKGTTKAVVGGGKRRKKRTNWDRLSYGGCNLNCVKACS